MNEDEEESVPSGRECSAERMNVLRVCMDEERGRRVHG